MGRDETHRRLEEELDRLRMVNELNEVSLFELIAQLDKLQNTKAWRVMLLVRRIHEQFFRGNSAERRKFVRWVADKLTGKPISSEWGLARYNPLPSVNIRSVSKFSVGNNKPLFEEQPVSTPYTETQDTEADDADDKVSVRPEQYQSSLDIFRFAVIEWDFRWQRPQQFSTRFGVHGHRVFYVSVDTIGLEQTGLSYEEVAKHVVTRRLAANVWGVRLCSRHTLNAYRDVIQPGDDLRYLEWSVRAIRERFGAGSTVSILDLPFWSSLAFSMESNKVVYDCMDDHAGFSTNSPEMLTSENRLVQGADLVLTSSAKLFEQVQPRNENTVLIRNAGEYTHFSKPPQYISGTLANLEGPVIGYYGAISEWFDIRLVEQLAKRNAEWWFVLVGNTFGCDTSRVAKLPNVVLTGEVPYEQLPHYLYRFDVCLIPFLINRLTLATNPVKVYEYLAAGKPVVSTRLPEVELMRDFVYMATTVEEFEQSIQRALSEGKSAKLSEQRREFARVNTWESRYQQLENELFERFYPKVSVVIVTFDNWTMTRACLSTVLKKSHYPNLEVIIVDNNSTDETRERLAYIKDSRLKVILMPNNAGFAGGNAEGCRASSGEYIILLNNDTMVPDAWIERLIRVFNRDEQLVMAGPVSNSVGNDQTLDFFCGNALRGPDPNWLSELYTLYENRIRYTELLGFYCVAIRREAYEKVGDLDRNFGIGMFEDDDYCERIRQAGYRLAIVEDAFVYHYGSASFKKLDTGVRDELFERNKRYFETKWHKPWTAPNPPNTIFHGAMDAASIGRVVRNSGLKAICILGEQNWGKDYASWQQAAVALAKESLVIVNLLTYHGQDFTGTRKLGPNLYITNVIGFFSETEFDIVIYCGHENTGVNLHAKQVVVDSSAYDNDTMSDLLERGTCTVVESLADIQLSPYLSRKEVNAPGVQV